MRGRTNVQGFDESSLNADVVNAIADETINSGNFVKFYNAINGGYDTELYFYKVKELSDGRLMCIGNRISSSSINPTYVVILERDSEGNFVKNLPDYLLDSEWSDNVVGYGNRIFDVDDDTVGFIQVYGNQSTSENGKVYLKVVFVKFDVVLNQIVQEMKVVQTDIASYLHGSYNSSGGGSYYPASSEKNFGFESRKVFYNFVKINNVVYLFVNAAYHFRYSTSVNYYKSYGLFCIQFTIGSNNAVTYNGGRVISQYASQPSQSLDPAGYVGNINAVYSENGNGFFVFYYVGYISNTRFNYSYCLQFVSLYDFIRNSEALPSVITFETKFTDRYADFLPFAVNGDDLFLIRIKLTANHKGSVYCFKIHFYDYTAANYSYLIYDEVSLGITDIAFYGDSGQYWTIGVNFCFLYENVNIKRYYITFMQSDTQKVVSLLVDVDKEESEVIVNPFVVESDIINGSYSLGYRLDNILYNSNTHFVVPKGTKVFEYIIVNDSELGGTYQNILHVLNATDENFIQGVAKQSGVVNQVVECYKAKVT